MCPAWEEKYPLTILQRVAREISDHTPLFLDTGETYKHKYTFRYENAWILREGFKELVHKTWNERYIGDILERWQLRLRNLRKKTKGWNKNVDAWYRKNKIDIVRILDEIDRNTEIRGITAEDRKQQKELRDQLKRVMIQEEIKIIQRYKEREIIEGDGNTRYYHAKVNGRRRKNRIISLEQDEGTIEGDDNLMEYITNFYKNFLGILRNPTYP